jgi:hypothetical protein
MLGSSGTVDPCFTVFSVGVFPAVGTGNMGRWSNGASGVILFVFWAWTTSLLIETEGPSTAKEPELFCFKADRWESPVEMMGGWELEVDCAR